MQTLRTGEVNVCDVPVPALNDNFILLRNCASVISAGTEKSKIDMGKKNLVQKALSRPDLARQVLNKIKTEGFSKTFQTVNTRLDAPSPLGYSCAGEVVAVGGLVEGIRPGDRVACGGADLANHAELVSIPKNLVVKVPDGVPYEEAAFTTVGSIALQGVRLMQPLLGERFLVIGLGLLGQIAVQLLRANGCDVIGTDLNPDLVRLGEKWGMEGILPGSDPVEACRHFSQGHGVDGVLICAGTSSNQPIELAGEVCRDKGRVVVVGAVKMDIPREPYFKKEISVTISRSYGPGRYDPGYEYDGHDYPIGYVRFTEQRNMQSFLNLVGQKKVDLQSLITHRFELDQAPQAYKLLEGQKKEPYLGIVLNYSSENVSDSGAASRIVIQSEPVDKDKIGISFFGAGNYATASLLPLLKANSKVEMRGLVTNSGRTAHGVASQFGFSFCASSYDELLSVDTDSIFITTRHDTHASSVCAALHAGKHVYVEKPLALNVEELQAVHAVYKEAGKGQLMVGFNRRFAPSTLSVIDHFKGVHSPLVVNIRVNAGAIPPDHWIQNPEQGGGRIIGEGCHFIDLACALANDVPASVYMRGMASADKSPILNDNVLISVQFTGGGIANICYVSGGSGAMSKEYVEVFGGGRSAIIDDFKSALLFDGNTGKKKVKLAAQDKGQKAMLAGFIDALKRGRTQVPYDVLMCSSLATVLAVESMLLDRPLPVDLTILDAVNNG